MKLLKTYYWYVKMHQCGFMEHGLKDIKCYVHKHIAPWAICYDPPLVRDIYKPLGAPTYCETNMLAPGNTSGPFH